MFTDIVGSTEKLSAHGDAHWRHQLDAHDRVVDWLLEKYGGHRATHTGDGVFALFDGLTKARARWNWSRPSRRVVSESERASTSVSASDGGDEWRDGCAHRRSHAHWQVQVRCWRAARSVISPPVRA